MAVYSATLQCTKGHDVIRLLREFDGPKENAVAWMGYELGECFVEIFGSGELSELCTECGSNEVEIIVSLLPFPTIEDAMRSFQQFQFDGSAAKLVHMSRN